MIDILVDSRLRLSVVGVPKDVIKDLQGAFTHSNPKFHKLRGMGYKFNKEPRSYRMSVLKDGVLSMARGGTNRVREVLAKRGLHEGQDWRFVAQMSEGQTQGWGDYQGMWIDGRLFPEPMFKMREHQTRIIEGIKRRRQCIIRSPTGSGKTWSILAAIADINLPALVVMNSSQLLNQWVGDIEELLGLKKNQVGVVGGGKFDLKPLTLAMNQTLCKLSNARWQAINDRFGFVGLDEVQGAAARTFVEVIDKSTAAYRVGVSDDETRADGKEFLIYDLFGGVEVEVSRDELEASGVIHDVGIRVVPSSFDADWHKELRDRRRAGEDNVENPDFNRLLDDMRVDEERNDLIREVVTGLQEKDETTFVFSHRVDHCRWLDSAFTMDGHKGGLLLGGPEWSEIFQANKAAIKAGKLKLGVGTYKAIGQGQNIPSAVSGVATTPIHKNRQFVQQVCGRLCRKSEGKTSARLYYIWDWKIYGNSPVRNFIRWKNDVRVWDGVRWADAQEYLGRTNGSSKHTDTIDDETEEEIGGIFGSARG